MKIYLSCIFITISLITQGCASVRYKIPIPKDELNQSSAEALLQKLVKSSEEVKSYQGLSLATLVRKGEQNKVRYLVVVEKPNKIHFEALPVNSGIAMIVLKSDGKNAIVLDTAPQIAYSAIADKDLIKNTLSLPIDPGDLIYFLTGRIPVRALKSQQALRFYEDKTTKKIVITFKKNQEIYEISSETGLLENVVFMDKFKGIPEVEFSWNEYKSFGASNSLPKVISIALPQYDVQAKLDWRQAEINKTPKPNLFDTEPPAGYSVEPLKAFN